MLTLFVFVIILGILVLVHEIGHFVAAKKTGMKVEEFGIGLPPRIFGFYRDKITKKIVWIRGNKLKDKNDIDSSTEEYPNLLYSLNWLPLGGFCRIKGENGPDEDGKEEKDSFYYQKAWKKILTLCAGVTMNFLLAAVLLSVGLMIGLPTDISDGIDEQAILVTNAGVMIQQVMKDSPAEEAKLKMGDRVLQANDKKVENTADLVEYINNHGNEKVDLIIQRGGEEKIIAVIPKINNEGEPARIGVALAEAAIVKYPWYRAIYKGFFAASIGLINIFIAFWYLFKNLFLGRGLIYDISGPVGIATLIGDSYRLGISYLINVTATISLSLTAINILPIPALDGGRILFILIEKIIRRKVPLKYEQIAHTVGYLALLALIALVTLRDVIKLF